jgi:hypothetical protein
MAIALSHKLPRLPADVSKAERPGGFRFHIVLLFAAVLLGSFLQVMGPAWFRTILEQGRLASFTGAATLLLALFASMMAHELGHLSAAVFLNYELLGGAIGPLRLDLWRGKAIFRLERGNWSRCSIAATPRQLHNVWRGRMMMVVAAGPAVSLLFFLVAAVAALHGAKLDESWPTAFWSCCAEVNFFLFILGLVPNDRLAPIRNDAALFICLWRNDADALDMFMCHRAIELSLRGIRPDEFPQPLLAELAGFEGRPYTRLMVARRIVEWAVDSGEIKLAGEWDKAALAAGVNCSPRLANGALAESACFDVLFREDMRSAVHKFARVEFHELYPPSLAERSWAARLIACDLPHRAPAHILRAQYLLPLGNPYYNYERALLDKLHLKALSQSRRGSIEN